MFSSYRAFALFRLAHAPRGAIQAASGPARLLSLRVFGACILSSCARNHQCHLLHRRRRRGQARWQVPLMLATRDLCRHAHVAYKLTKRDAFFHLVSPRAVLRCCNTITTDTSCCACVCPSLPDVNLKEGDLRLLAWHFPLPPFIALHFLVSLPFRRRNAGATQTDCCKFKKRRIDCLRATGTARGTNKPTLCLLAGPSSGNSRESFPFASEVKMPR